VAVVPAITNELKAVPSNLIFSIGVETVPPGSSTAIKGVVVVPPPLVMLITGG
jgi:hypothetical protein